jgi:hypothetical protein
MSGLPVRAILAKPIVLKPGVATSPADVARAQAVLAAPPAGQISLLSDPLSATVQNPLGEPAQARGMQKIEQIGPVIGPNGPNHIIIILPVTTSPAFAFGSTASPFGVIPIVNAPASGTQFTLGAGSLWFETNLMVPAVAEGSFSGFLISGGTLTASSTITLESGTYVAPAARR